ncbi:pullulanase [Prevotellaceae bacterium HUN156]|nr:pullulanase [Prevotellaceae bacterium HUN156]
MKKLLITTTCLLMSILASAQDFHFDEVTYSPEQTVFKLFAPNNAKCYVKVGKKKVKMTRMGDCLWTATVKGDLKGQAYVFNAGHGDTPGVFAKAVGVNGKQGYILDMRDTDPENWKRDKRPVCKSPSNLVIYELHHRDFSVARKEAKYPGKYLALTEPWALHHLQTLGINAVHILPSYDYGSVDETCLNEPQYNWGYDPVNYNVPEGGYSTNPADPIARIREFKEMVKALHNRGIRVILDVVYNHTYDIEHSNFQKTYPDYFYRKTPLLQDGAGQAVYSNGSGCGNETASEKPMMRQFMIESVKYWINEYHIDGFRFDLMGCHDIETMNEIRKAVDEIDPSIFIYGEGWSAGSCALPTEQLGVKANIPEMPRIAAFSDEIRDALRGPFDNDTKAGWLGGAPNCEESLKYGIVGGISHPQVNMKKVNYSQKPWALQPPQMISYVSCHDDMCLVDRLKASIPNITDDELIRLDLLAQTAVFTSQGVPFMLSGEELLRSKKGVHNSFESPDSINQLNWDNKLRYPQVFEYYKNLIQLRKSYPHFHLGSAEQVRKNLEFLDTPKGVVAYQISASDDCIVRNLIVILNATRQEQTISVPQRRYRVICANGAIDIKGLDYGLCNQVTVAPQTAFILHD